MWGKSFDKLMKSPGWFRCVGRMEAEMHSNPFTFLSRSNAVPRLPAVRVQRGEHPVLAGLRGVEEGDERRGGRGEGALYLRGLHLDTVTEGGELLNKKKCQLGTVLNRYNYGRQVSLDSRVREVVNRNMVEPTPHTFDDAQLQIYTLMHRDSYPR